jgi:nitrite reductase (NO-forming)
MDNLIYIKVSFCMNVMVSPSKIFHYLPHWRDTMKNTGAFKFSLATLALGISMAAGAAGVDYLPRITQDMVAPPALPEHTQVATSEAKVVEVELIIEEKQEEIAPGVDAWVMTFGGTVPGPMIVAHEGDYVEVTLKNPATNQFMHNIDFHAATGALGGAELSHVNPGEEVTFRFKATKAGVFVYHCAPGGSMIPWHVVSGMNGAIMVLPREGLKDETGEPVTYDRAYYIGEQDFYVPRNGNGGFKSYPNLAAGMMDTMNTMRTLTPSHVVFNGAVGALTGPNAMTAEVGEKVLFVHSQANRDSRPHLIGGHGDLVWAGGSFNDRPMTDQETWFVPGGAAVAALYEFQQPGLHAYVNHNLIEAIEFGAAAHVQVEGEWNDDLMTLVNPIGKM